MMMTDLMNPEQKRERRDEHIYFSWQSAGLCNGTENPALLLNFFVQNNITVVLIQDKKRTFLHHSNHRRNARISNTEHTEL